ncbi:MAG: MFS transporter [Spirochaetota bacterium]
MNEKTTTTTGPLMLVLFLGVLMGAMDIAILGPALPSMKADFGATERDLALLFSIYVLFNLVSTPLMAKLSDLFGRRVVYIADVSLFALGSIAVALSPSSSPSAGAGSSGSTFPWPCSSSSSGSPGFPTRRRPVPAASTPPVPSSSP